jgi:hypothetical protein
MSKHTPEPWLGCCNEDQQTPHYIFDQYTEKTICAIRYNDSSLKNYNDMEGDLTLEEARANSKRIVACVNYCKGATNEELESGTLESDLNKANEKLSVITKQRNELLAALKEAKGYIQGMLGRKRSTFLDEIDATIRNAEKGGGE